MNTTEKEKQQKMIVQNLKGIEFAVAEAVKVKDAARAKIQDLNMNGMKTYSQEYVETEMRNIQNEILVKMTGADADIAKRLEELRTLIHDRDSVLDLGNPNLTNALALIQTIGSNITDDQSVKINANFIHDQSSLRQLRAAYKAHGVEGYNAGEIDKLIYNADSRIDKLKELANNGLVKDGSINYFSTELAKLAELEGTTVEKMPDLQGADMAIRRAAGLTSW